MKPNTNLNLASNKSYLFSDSFHDPISQQTESKDFYLKTLDREEMNASPAIKELIANTFFHAAVKYQAAQLGVVDFSSIPQYNQENAPPIKDSNIKPDAMRGFLLEDGTGNPVSIILAGITQHPFQTTRIMMGTIDTIDECQDRGYFSILFDETVKKVAQENGGALPQVGISMRGLTSIGQNFETYTHVMKSRGFNLQGLQRELATETNPTVELDDAEEKILFRLNPKDSKELFAENFKSARAIVKKNDPLYEALFLQGIPTPEMNLENFTTNSATRFQAKINSTDSQIFINEALRERGIQSAQALATSSSNITR